MREKIS